MRVKLLSDLNNGDDVSKEGSVVDLSNEQAEKLIELGAATEDLNQDDSSSNDASQQEVETSTTPLEPSQENHQEEPDGFPMKESVPQNQEQSTDQPPSLNNLHLG